MEYSVDVEEILTKMGVSKIARSGHNINSTCPFFFKHSDGKDSHPSFSVEANPPYRAICGGCGTKGTIISLCHQYFQETGVSILEKKNSDFNKLEWKSRVKFFNKNDANFIGHLMFNFDDYKKYCRQLPQYAIDRGITVSQAKRWNLGFNPETKRLFIPVFSKTGAFVGYSERDVTGFSSPKYKHAKGFKRNLYLYGEHFLDKSSPICFLSEGFFDVYSLERAGLTNCFASMGTVPSKDQVNFLCQFEYIVIFPHQDKAQADGTRPGVRMAEAFKTELENRYKTVLLAPFVGGYKDVGDWPIESVHKVVEELLKDI